MARSLKPARFRFKALAALTLALLFILPALSALAGGGRQITVDQLLASLPPAPIAVGFDVDDTLLFSSPGFYYGFMNNDGPNGTNKYGKDFIKSPAFWKDMNSKFDKFSLPKRVVGKVFWHHFKRGDKVYVITARTDSPGERLSALLERVFKVKLAKPAVFTGTNNKTPAIKRFGLRIYYGDADTDVSSTLKAGARPIRVLRAINSNNPTPQHPGNQGEEILAGSQR